jgi:signal transduction histidine kinase
MTPPTNRHFSHRLLGHAASLSRQNRRLKGDFRGAEKRFQMLAGTTDQLVFVLNQQGIVEANRSACKLLEIDSLELPFDWRTRLETESLELAVGVHENWLEGRMRWPRRFTIVWMKLCGRPLELDLELSLARWQGEPAAFCVAKNNTEKADVHRRMQTAQKLETLGELAGGVAHDVNNLMGAISGHAELAMIKSDDKEAVRQEMEALLAVVSRGTGLMRRILAFSRRRESESRLFSLPLLIRETLGLLERLIGRCYTIEFNSSNIKGRMKGDPAQIEQALMNLVLNARDAMPDGGRILLHLCCRQLSASDEDRHERTKPGAYLVLSIHDEGSGISAADLDRIFDPLYTTKDASKGTGLGLATTFRVVKNANGQIQVLSAPGWGSRFDVYLPAVLDECEIAEPMPREPRRLLLLRSLTQKIEIPDADRLHWNRMASIKDLPRYLEHAHFLPDQIRLFENLEAEDLASLEKQLLALEIPLIRAE